jgi:hypothetical protein
MVHQFLGELVFGHIAFVVMPVPDRILEAPSGIPFVAVVYPFAIVLPAVESVQADSRCSGWRGISEAYRVNDQGHQLSEMICPVTRLYRLMNSSGVWGFSLTKTITLVIGREYLNRIRSLLLVNPSLIEPVFEPKILFDKWCEYPYDINLSWLVHSFLLFWYTTFEFR